MKITLATAPMSAATIARMAGGTLCLRATDTPPLLSHICTDSREADGTTLLCAIRGERVDGHTFLPAAARAGCPAFLCERLPNGWTDVSEESPMGSSPAAAIVVGDTVDALGRIGNACRTEVFPAARVVAVTGSVGKTTTKEMLAAVLSAAVRDPADLFKKDGNYNSTIGLPLSLGEVPPDTRLCVLEMGMSARGEIASMTRAARPDVALVINVGSSHLEHLGTRENIARAKLEIAEGLAPGGTLILNGDEPLLAHAGQDLLGDRPIIPAGVEVRYLSPTGFAGADIRVLSMAPAGEGMRFDLATPEGKLSDLYVPAKGGHMVTAAAFSAAVGLMWGMDEASVRRGLLSYRPAALRQGSRTVAGVTLCEDCYNAAPESMAAALSVLALAPGRRVAVLGDMKELGDNTVSLHRTVGEMAARRGVALLVTVGTLGAHIAAGARDAGLPAASILSFAETEPAAAVADHLAALLLPGDTVLFKASRAMALEAVSTAVHDRLATSTEP